MAAVHPSRHPHSRLRSPSDPFTDPIANQRRPPPPPPKTRSPAMPAPVSRTAPPAREPRDITEAVRDTVTVRGNTDYSPRQRVGRSQTSTLSPSANSKPTAKRSQSQDSTNRTDKQKSSGKSRSKKGSQHADIIDRLDFTGVGPMFHHDGPFDACAPSRNRQRNKAPMFAWSGRPEDALAHGDSAYPSAHAYKAFSNTNYVDPPKKKVDAIAEAWGTHEPEPYEEFFAGGGTGRTDGDTPGSSIYNGKDSHGSSRNGTTARRTKDGRDARDVYREYLEEGQTGDNNTPGRSRQPTRRTLVPPPKPIFVPDASEVSDGPGSSPPYTAGGFPKRSKSLLHRIRKMRDAPNVPVGSDFDQPPSPTSPVYPSYPGASGNAAARPTHRAQHSFLGRLAGGVRHNPVEKSEPFVYIDAHSSKALPATPQTEAYPDSAPVVGYEHPEATGSPGLGRKTSLMKKVGRVVGRSRA